MPADREDGGNTRAPVRRQAKRSEQEPAEDALNDP
jgi:hypothetical protein